jgi:hypothetical protein
MSCIFRIGDSISRFFVRCFTGHRRAVEKSVKGPRASGTLVLVIGFLLFSWSSVFAGVNDHVELTVASDASSALTIDLILKYVGSNSIIMRKGGLPWSGRGSIDLQVFIDDLAGKRIEEVVYISDPGPDKVTLLPGGIYKGSIFLDARYADIVKTHKNSNIVVKWSYTLRPLVGDPLPTLSGSLIIKKGR